MQSSAKQTNKRQIIVMRVVVCDGLDGRNRRHLVSDKSITDVIIHNEINLSLK